MKGKTAEAFLGLGAVMVGAVIACGSGNLNLSSLGGTACTQGVPTQWYQNGNAACASCVEKSCATQEKCLGNACAGYGQCFCACGIGDLNCYSNCQPDLSSACTSCEDEVSRCVSATCTSSCGDGGTPSGSGSGGGADAAPAGFCQILAKCCKEQTGVAAQVCNEVASNNDVSVCQAAYAGLLDGGDCH